MYKPLPISSLKSGVMYLHDHLLASDKVHLDSPASAVMTHVDEGLTIRPEEKLTRAIARMTEKHTSLLVVVGMGGEVEGLLTINEVLSEAPLAVLREQPGMHYANLTVGDLMIPRSRINVISEDAVQASTVGSIVATLENHAHDYALVTRVEQYLGVEVISGVFHLSRIERKLGKPHQDAPARSFAEISFALAH